MSDRLDRYLDDFGSDLLGGRSRWRAPWGGLRVRTLVLVVLLLAALVATALAATGVLSGSPVRDPYGERVKPSEGIGAPLAASAHLTSLRVADPGGGPPWGMRILKTTRGAGCVQIGRVLDGKLGVLGRDGAFHNDHLFHVMGPDVVSRSDCEGLDGAGKLYLSMSVQGLPFSAWPDGCTPSAAHFPPIARKHHKFAARCPRSDERILYYGTLGPGAVSVSYRDSRDQLQTAPTQGPEGAYLVVIRSSRRHPATGMFVPGQTPASGLSSVRYRDGHVCRIPDPRQLGGAKDCPMVAYVEPAAPRLPRRTSRVLVARFSAHPVHPRIGPPPGTPAPETDWKLTISFHAPVSTPGASTYYIVTRGPMHGPGPYCRNTETGPIVRSLQRGQIARTAFFISPRCSGQVRGIVVLHHSGHGRFADQMPFAGAPFHDPVIGRYSAPIPTP